MPPSPAAAGFGYWGTYTPCSYAANTICYHWKSSPPFTGSTNGIWGSNSDVLNNPWLGFVTAGGGQYQALGNNTGSFRNLDQDCYARIWRNAGWMGLFDSMVPNGSLSGNFQTRNDNRGQSLYSCS